MVLVAVGTKWRVAEQLVDCPRRLSSDEGNHRLGASRLLAPLLQNLSHAGCGFPRRSGEGDSRMGRVWRQAAEKCHQVMGHLGGLPGARATEQDADAAVLGP